MTTVLDTTKSNLGKLLASENIRVEHRQTSGPYFDVKDRVLALPIWKDVDSDLYDLMIGHEVGHALFTPAEGWQLKVKEKGRTFQTFLNLVEDARIEKFMKRKYPGLRRPMYLGYTQLVERGFFGMSLSEMHTLPIADRINVYFKLGVRSNVSFTDREQDFVTRLEQVETWDEVEDLAAELYQMAKAEKDNMQNEEGEEGESKAGEREGEEGDSNSGDNTYTDGDMSDHMMSEDNGVSNNSMNEHLRKWMDTDEIYSITEQTFANNEEKLIDSVSYPHMYATWPELNLENWVVPASVTHSTMKFTDNTELLREKVYANFMATNKKYVNYLVKEFELRRNAKQFAKAKVSKTGDLDIDKIWKYRLSEDLFMQSMVVPNGKNHGMLMIVDMSGSMSDNMQGTLEQIISLSMFCRKVNIPFDVYGFIDNGYAERELTNVDFSSPSKGLDLRNDPRLNSLYISNDNFRLKQLLHHRMKTQEFNAAMKNLLLCAETYKGYYHGTPISMALGGTPLNEAILVLRHVAEKFKTDTKVEILNTIILTDGAASYSPCIMKESGAAGIPWKTHLVIKDAKTHVQNTVGSPDNMPFTDKLVETYKEITGSRVIGLYLMSGQNYRSQLARASANTLGYMAFEKQYKEQFLKHRYFNLKKTGHDAYFMVSGNDLEIEDTTMSDFIKPSHDTNKKSTLLKAFKQMQNTKQISRVFLNQFIQQIS